MPGNGWRRTIGLWLKHVFPTGDDEAIRSLKVQMQALKNELAMQESARSESLLQEIEILRNEIQENIAAIHRLEILTLEQRLTLLQDFGKELPPTSASRTRASTKPRGLSFGIITNGKRPEKLEQLIESIERQRLPIHTFEILIAGCVADIPARERLRTFPMEDAAAGGRLGAMRNVLASASRFNKFVSLDDDLLLHSGWARAVNEIDDDFDLATGIILNPDLSRYCDWVNKVDKYTFLRPYHEEFATCQYLTGGYGIYKDYVVEQHAWNDSLGFYQGEDVTFSKKLFDAGYQLKFIPKAIVMHDDERYRQKGYGVIRWSTSCRDVWDGPEISQRMEKLCPQTLS